MRRSIGSSAGEPDHAPPPRTEGELLAREEQRARAGVRASVRGLGEDLLQTVDARCRVARHPLPALAASLCTGFLLARPARRLIGSQGLGRTLLRSVTDAGARLAGLNFLERAVSTLVANLRRGTTP